MASDAETRLQRETGRRIAELRRLRGWTQEQLAERLGTSAKYVQDVERGTENLTLQSLARFAKMLRVRPGTLLRAPVLPKPRVGRPRATTVPFEEVEPAPGDLFQRCVPLVTLEAAAGPLRAARLVETASWVVPRSRVALTPGMFVARIVGDSMAPEIDAGAWGLFRPLRGDAVGRIVLARHRVSDDPEDGGAFVIKRVVRGRGNQLRLTSANRRYRPIAIDASRSGEWEIVAELVEVLDASD